MNIIQTFLSDKLYWFSFICIMGLAIIIAGYKLGSVPHGLTWDEAAIGYNGYAIFTTRRDEWLTKLPISFRSFGDYKAPLAIYLNGLSTAVFGLNAVGIRLPFMIASVMSVVGMMLLVRLLWQEKKWMRLFSISAGFFMVTSPWFVHYSRAGFESGIALFFTIFAVYFFLLFRKYPTSLPAVLSILFFVLSLYTYHSSKVVAPLLGLFLLYFCRKEIVTKRVFVRLVGAGLGGIVLSYFLLKDALLGDGLERAGVTLFSHYSFWEAIALSTSQLLSHLLPSFLISGATTTLRHGDGNWGVLLLPMYLLVWLSLLLLIPKMKENISKDNLWLGLAWVLIGLVPAAIATEVPHSNRALLALPGFIILATVAFELLARQFKSLLYLRLLVGCALLFQSIFFVAYIKDYFTVFAAQSAADFKDGYIDAFEIAQQYEHGSNGKPEVAKIIFASDYGQPYIYGLLVRKTNPIEYQHGSLLRYEFRDDISKKDLEISNILVVAVPGDISDVIPTHTVFGSDGEAKFEIFLTENYY